MQCKSNKETKIKNQIVTCTEHMYSFNKIIDNQVKKMQLTIMHEDITPLERNKLMSHWPRFGTSLIIVMLFRDF